MCRAFSKKAKIDVVHFEDVTSGYAVKENIDTLSKEIGKEIQIIYWQLFSIENRKAYSATSDVLWPLNSVSNNTAQEIIDKIDATRRSGEGSSQIFSSNANRLVLEEQFIIAGQKIISSCYKPNLQHLGFHQYKGFGFGAMTATYRKCPNNAPLALWWGKFLERGPLGAWYPLLPREPMISFRNRKSIFSARKSKNT